MAISMHSASVPIFVGMLGNMLGWLDKAEAHAKAKNFDPDNYLGLRLTPDMLPFSRQIQIASDACKRCLSGLAGLEAPTWEDDEGTLDRVTSSHSLGEENQRPFVGEAAARGDPDENVH